MRVRRVVTGHDKAGKAVVVSDEDVHPTDPDHGPKWSIWAVDSPVALPDDGARPDFAGRWSRGPVASTSSSSRCRPGSTRT